MVDTSIVEDRLLHCDCHGRGLRYLTYRYGIELTSHSHYNLSIEGSFNSLAWVSKLSVSL
jgi:hypothetical protein